MLAEEHTVALPVALVKAVGEKVRVVQGLGVGLRAALPVLLLLLQPLLEGVPLLQAEGLGLAVGE